MPVVEALDYISKLRQLREEYRNQIEIAIGFEMEYYSHHFKAMLEQAHVYGGGYLILGQHYICDERPDSVSWKSIFWGFGRAKLIPIQQSLSGFVTESAAKIN